MNWLVVTWSMIASACLTLALVHLFIWLRQRSNRPQLLFSLAAIGVAGIAVGELMMMRARTPEQFGVALRWTHVPIFLTIVSIVGFVRVYLHAGRAWLAWTIFALRLLVLMINFSVWPNLNYKEISSLRQVSLWGGEFAFVEHAVTSPWTRLGAFSSLLFLGFVVDATISAWRRGNSLERRRAAAVGGSLAFFIFVGTIHTMMIHEGVIRSPYLISIPFLVPLAVMGYELGTDVVYALGLAEQLRTSRNELRDSNERFRLVVEAAPSAMIMVSPQGKIELVNAHADVLFGYDRAELVGKKIGLLVPGPLQSAHPQDCKDHLSKPTPREMRTGRELFGRRKDGSEVPVEIALNPIQTSEGLFVLASITDITERRHAERESARQRNELAHLSRVTMLGELSGSLAHELNQPLTAILSNAQAAQRFLARDEPDLDEVRGILKDIVDEDKRAGEVIHRLRLLFRKGEVQRQLLNINDVVRDVLTFLNSDLVNHMVTASTELHDALPQVQADRVQLQQVLINLIVNACDAMSAADASDRKLLVRTEIANGNGVELSVVDRGCGIPPERMEAVFDPFVTTKKQGMGLGLAVSRTIVSAHGGKLWATNNPDRGASFHIALPTPHAAIGEGSAVKPVLIGAD